MDHAAEAEHHFPQPPSRVFEGFSNSDLFGRWFMADWGKACVSDFRVGGEYRIDGVTPQGTEVSCLGAFEEIDAPHRLAYTFEWIGNEEDPDSVIPEKGPRPVTVDLRDADDGGTDLHFRHDGLMTEASANGHLHAWKACLGILEKLLTQE